MRKEKQTNARMAVTRRSTIKDVAQAAGVSISTVSNYLNGRVDTMTEDTQSRIREIVAFLQYRPNGMARGLANRRTATIGLIIWEIETPLFILSLNVIEPIARSMGYNILICNARNVDDERQAINLLLEKEVEGFIFFSTSVYSDATEKLGLVGSDKAAVFINRATTYHDSDQINWDNAGGVAAAVEYLAKLGHRRIAHLHGPANRRSSAERLNGYRQGLEKAALEYRPEYVRPGDYTAGLALWLRSTQELLALSDPPTAIIAADDIVAAIAMKTAQRAGFRVPQDLAIIGIDDQPFDTYLNPALTTVQLPVPEAGKRAIQMLVERVENRRTVPEHVILPCPLIIRESCGTPLTITEERAYETNERAGIDLQGSGL